MKLHIIISILFFTLSACNELSKESDKGNNLEDKATIEKNAKEIKSLRTKLAETEKQFRKLEEYQTKNSEHICKLPKEEHLILDKLNLTNLLSFDKDKIISQIVQEKYSYNDFNKETFNFLFMEIEANVTPFEDFIAYNPIFIRRKLKPDEECFSSVHYIDRDIETPVYMCKLNKLYSNFDRTPDNISKVFNEEILNHIASLFNYNILPKDYKLYELLKGLLMTYEELDDNECDRIYRFLDNEGTDNFVYWTDFNDEFQHIISDNVRSYVTTTPYIQHYNNTSAGHEKRMFYLYSFWARRYNEGTKEAVYNILKRLNGKIK